jgi:hypothetical protein
LTFELTKVHEKDSDPGNRHRLRVAIPQAFEELNFWRNRFPRNKVWHVIRMTVA